MKLLATVAFSLFFFFSCRTGGQNITKKEKPLPAPVLSEALLQKQMNGVDFFAKGNVPASWTLEMDFGNLIRFKSIDGSDANCTAVQPVSIPEKNATSYTSKATNGFITIMVYDEQCNEALSSGQFSKKVEVSINEKIYRGCGQYLFDVSLNGRWVLEKINNSNLQDDDFAKGLPEMKFELSAGRLSGHDGCNNFTGAFEVLGSKINFKPFAGTKMACPANKPENEFIHLLSGQVVDYYFKEEKLLFYLKDDSIIVFRKG
jgi:heat shock protein HslJ/uncharacterized membrane protein